MLVRIGVKLRRLLHLNDAIRDTSFCFQISDSDSLGELFI